MQISVIIPTYNAAETIATQLEALINQNDAAPFEIIVADNGSIDGTVAIADQYQQRFPHLRVIDASSRRGAAYARNVGASVAQGELLLFCDADDEVDPNWVTAMTTALSQYDFVGGVNEFHKLNAPTVVQNFAGSEGGSGVTETFYLPEASSNNLGIKRSIHEAVGGFDEAFLKIQDVDYCWCVQEAGIQLHSAPDAIVHFRFRPSLADNFHRWRKTGYCSVLLYRKHAPYGLPQWQIWKGFLAGLAIPVKFVLRVRDPSSFVQWWLNCGWCLGYLQGWLTFGWKKPAPRMQPCPIKLTESPSRVVRSR